MNRMDRESIEQAHRRNLGVLELESREAAQTQLAAGLRMLQHDNRNPEVYIELARLYRRLDQTEVGITLLQKGIRLCEPSVDLYRHCINRLEECNRTSEAISTAREAGRVFPDDLILALREATILPAIYDTEADIYRYRDRYAQGLSRVSERIRLDTSEARENAVRGLGQDVFKYLAYQGLNDRSHQAIYGELAHRIMAASYPQWTRHLAMPAVEPAGKIRIGYVSTRFAHSSAMKAFAGWIREHDREVFSIFCYHLASQTDAVTDQIKSWSTCFRQLSASLDQIAAAIRADDLHIIVFLDHGVSPMMTQLAALRVAPVQCMAWDNPVTSGLPTVDYFISARLMEPYNAEEHYSENLVRLPGIGMCYSKPVIPSTLLSKGRGDFKLREDSVAFLSGQTVLKHLPDHDEICAQIAKQLPNSQFLFIVRDGLGKYLLKRLERAFSSVSLGIEEHVVLIPEQSMFDYWNLLSLSDVLLDTTGWSGLVTSIEAIACGLPVVTMAGPVMRGRQSYGVLKQLGVTETIAANKRESVEIAVRLGLDRESRADIVQRMKQGYASLFGDTRCVVALEEFFRDVVAEKSQESPALSNQSTVGWFASRRNIE